MALEDDKVIAMEFLRQAVEPDVEPALLDETLSAILDQNQVAKFWASATLFLYGDVVMPSTKNGHRYICAKAGASGAMEPAWPTAQGARVSDGAAIWMEDGPQSENAYHVGWAIHCAWVAKAAKAQSCTDWKAGGISNSGSQVFDHCLKMAEITKPFEVA